ncbi:hypothetical protein GTU79_00305 [Sodalis ligni]|nr:hypothetical protein GTU79_00305 [Sodalis ligni]
MEARRVPTGFRIMIFIFIFLLTFLLLRPSTPVTDAEYSFWNKMADYFGELDVEGFVGLALLITCPIFTIIVYQMVIRLAEKLIKMSVID